MAIYFYDHPYYYYSNFSAHAVEYKGKLYPTVEHAYQAQKFTDAAIQEEIRLARSPLAAKLLANEKYQAQQRPDWDEVRVGIMGEAVRAKTEQHVQVREALLASGDEELVEDSPEDVFWGCGADKTGQNQLGKLWMKVRADLRARS